MSDVDAAKKRWRERFKARVAVMTNLLGRSKPDDLPTPRAVGDDDEQVAQELTRCLGYAVTVNKVLPIDHDADRAADRAMQKYWAKQTKRKITR